MGCHKILGSLPALSHNVTLPRSPPPPLACDIIYGCPILLLLLLLLLPLFLFFVSFYGYCCYCCHNISYCFCYYYYCCLYNRMLWSKWLWTCSRMPEWRRLNSCKNATCMMQCLLHWIMTRAFFCSIQMLQSSSITSVPVHWIMATTGWAQTC